MTEADHRHMVSVYVREARAIPASSPYNNWRRRDWLKQAREHMTAAKNIAYQNRWKGI